MDRLQARDAGKLRALTHKAPEFDDTWKESASGRGPSATFLRRPAGLLHLRRTAGNAAVTESLQREAASTGSELTTHQVLDVVGKGGGQLLATDVRADMESRLADDFSDVRVHTDAKAAESAALVSAKAYTVGNEIVFNRGSFAPGSSEGRRRLAHELVHVQQQRNGPVSGTGTGRGVAISHPSDSFEQHAEKTASRAVSDPKPTMARGGIRLEGCEIQGPLVESGSAGLEPRILRDGWMHQSSGGDARTRTMTIGGGTPVAQRDEGSDSYKLGYEDGKSGAPENAGSLAGDERTDYSEGYLKGSYELKAVLTASSPSKSTLFPCHRGRPVGRREARRRGRGRIGCADRSPPRARRCRGP